MYKKQKKIKNRDKINAVNNVFRSLRLQSYYEQQQRDYLENLKILFNKICECMYYINRKLSISGTPVGSKTILENPSMLVTFLSRPYYER